MSYILLSKQAFFSNLEALLAYAPKEKIALVLKDNAYGHGLEPMAEMAAEWGIEKAVVRTVAEGTAVAGKFQTVLVLADLPRGPVPGNLHFTVNAPEELERIPAGTPVHLKVDTGMHRNGILPESLETALEAVDAKGLALAGLFTHPRSADLLSSELFWQLETFKAVVDRTKRWCMEKGRELPAFHFANSAALLRLGAAGAFDMARVGIAAYGYTEMEPVFSLPELKPVLSLWGEKIGERRLKKGQRVGYGGSFRAAKAMVASTYDIGYGDGFMRLDGSRPYPLPGGGEILGKVSMDNLSVSGNDDAVCLLDDARVPAERFGTISYDILVKLSPLLERRIS